MKISLKMREVLVAVATETERRGFPPTQSEIAIALGKVQASWIARRLGRLRDLGFLSYGKEPRSLRLTVDGQNVLNS